MGCKHGIDVSEYNGKIDWKKVKDSGRVDFAIIRSGLGWTTGNIGERRDTRFEANVAGCEENGIPYGIYHYSYCLKADNAKREAEYILRLIRDKSPTWGVWLDVEANAQISLGRDAITKITADECGVLKEAGYDAGVYSYLYWLEHYMDMSRLMDYPVWLAQVDVQAPTYRGAWTLWQYSWKGSVDGIVGDVDMNRTADVSGRITDAEIVSELEGLIAKARGLIEKVQG